MLARPSRVNEEIAAVQADIAYENGFLERRRTSPRKHGYTVGDRHTSAMRPWMV
jgi:hypothetical protein